LVLGAVGRLVNVRGVGGTSRKDIQGTSFILRNTVYDLCLLDKSVGVYLSTSEIDP
jgi:hypothetical protein